MSLKAIIATSIRCPGCQNVLHWTPEPKVLVCYSHPCKYSRRHFKAPTVPLELLPADYAPNPPPADAPTDRAMWVAVAGLK